MPPKRLALAAALALSTSAALALDVTLLPDPTVTGRYAVSFEMSHGNAGSFADTFNIVSPVDGFLSFSLDSVEPVGTSGVFFQGYQVNGGQIIFFNNVPSHVTIDSIPITAGPQSLLVGGVAAPGATPRTPVSAGYTGTIAVGAIPEPQTWLLMAGGLLALVVVAKRHRPAPSQSN